MVGGCPGAEALGASFQPLAAIARRVVLSENSPAVQRVGCCAGGCGGKDVCAGSVVLGFIVSPISGLSPLPLVWVCSPSVTGLLLLSRSPVRC